MELPELQKVIAALTLAQLFLQDAIEDDKFGDYAVGHAVNQKIIDEANAVIDTWNARTAVESAAAGGGEVRVVCSRHASVTGPYTLFLEVEDAAGKSIRVPWHDRSDGLTELRLYAAPVAAAQVGEVDDAMVERADDVLITVCSSCLRACCWQGEFMCDEAEGAGTVQRKVSALRANPHGESEHYWQAEITAALSVPDGKGGGHER
jgi:hypothetical protein